MRPLKDLFMHELLCTGNAPVPSDNAITGNFKGTTVGTLEIAELPSGTYPLIILIYLHDGYYTDSELGKLTGAKYNLIEYLMQKQYPNLAPEFAHHTGDNAIILVSYKSASTAGQNIGNNVDRGTQDCFNNLDIPSTGASTTSVKFGSDNKIKVRITASETYGFRKDIQYDYVIVHT